MRTLSLLILLALPVAATVAHAQPDPLREPWRDTATALVIDPYEGNTIVWDSLALERRVAGIIHRATIGSRVDRRYAERRKEARRRGYLWGSYHLGRPGGAVAQADFHLATVGVAEDEVRALDIESLDSTRDMSLDSARRFLLRVHERTGRWPLLYANDRVARAISARFAVDTVFSNTPLWYARFRHDIPDFPAGVWRGYTLWQFSCEINCNPKRPDSCPYRVPGTRTDMDLNIYNGTVEGIRERWPFGR